MADPKTLVGAAITLGAMGNAWIEQAQIYGQLAITGIGIVVGLLTIWYTIERVRKIRHERKDHDEKEHK